MKSNVGIVISQLIAPFNGYARINLKLFYVIKETLCNLQKKLVQRLDGTAILCHLDNIVC